MKFIFIDKYFLSLDVILPVKLRFFIISVLIHTFLLSQTNKSIFYLEIKSNNNNLTKKLRYNNKFNDTVLAILEIKKIINQYRNKGYLEVNLDSIGRIKNNITAFLHFGNTYKWNKIILSDSIKKLLGNTFKFREKLYTNQVLSLEEFERFNENILKKFENDGYPFVKIKYIKTKINNENEITTELVIDKSRRIKINKIHIKGNRKIHPKFIQTYIQVKEGSWYNEENIQKISSRIREVSYIKEIKPHEILFVNDGAELFLYLETSKSSNFDGILGIQPNNQTGKINVTGEVKLKLQNLIKRGELLNLEWRKLQPQTQNFIVQINYPFLFRTQFGVDGIFRLYKRDSSFLNLNSNIGLQYILKGGNYFKVFYEFQSSSTLNSITNFKQENIVDIRKHIYGISFNKKQYDYLPNPKKGYSVEIKANLGNKKLKKRNNIPDSLYDGLRLNDISYGFNLKADVFLPFLKRNTIRLANQTKMIFSKELFFNESLRFGGLNSLRGFDEEFFYATFFSLFSFEYRFLIDYKSAVFAFFDMAFYERNIRDNYTKNLPFGFGIGLNMGTKFGTFSISYAFGKQQGEPLLIRNGKIHFGYIVYF